MSMFCYQCQETLGNKGCTVNGVCGKKGDVANLQDLLLYRVKGLMIWRKDVPLEVRKKYRQECNQFDEFIVAKLFSTITNTNFSREYFEEAILATLEKREQLKQKLQGAGLKPGKLASHDAANFTITKEDMDAKAGQVGVLQTQNEDVRSLRQLITFGVKGIAAYAEHALRLGKEIKELVMFMEKALTSTLDDELSVEELVALVLETGKNAVDTMATLDAANTEAYGNPEITEVNIGVRKNPAILISGHDLKDMEQLLEQTQGTGVDVYTHGEMLPANYYPAFKKYEHFVGNYGGSWWQQTIEFEKFNGPIILTTNCLVPPKASYKDRVFTANSVAFDGVKHI
ncbi:MAG TPA: hydroxylamine reductase, partial [Candidatus Cloacimonas sp.]|nr:hydroxylamine reductase [Candidatus Cloacimonas sp.]